MTKIKVCGLKTTQDALFAHQAGADALGFIIDVPVVTPRKVTSQKVADIITQLPPYALTVGVVMPASPTELLTLIEKSGVNTIQIHGNNSSLEIPEIKKKKHTRFVRSYPIAVNTEVNAAIKAIGEYIDRGADAILLDTKGKKDAGGTGEIHDWRKSKEIKNSLSCPVILAGGLNPHNVSDAIRLVEPYAVDVASGVESSPGVKDHQKIKAFIRNVRNL